MSNHKAILADIGGTNARFALTNQAGDIAHLQIYKTANYSNLGDAAGAYLAYLKTQAVPVPSAAVFAVGTAVTSDQIVFPNSPWSFSQSSLQLQMGLQKLLVINDFAAVAMSIPHLKDHERQPIGGGQFLANQPIGVIGPGTGLGVASLIPNGQGGWIPVPGEGGHVTAPAIDDVEWQVIQKLHDRYHHISVERIASGKGLVNVYEAISELDDAAHEELSAEEISTRAIEGTCPVCQQTLDIFCNMLGTVAGNLALITGAFGGIYIAGGITPKILGYLQKSGFRERFEGKGRRREYMQLIPTYAITADNIAFRGLAAYANQYI